MHTVTAFIWAGNHQAYTAYQLLNMLTHVRACAFPGRLDTLTYRGARVRVCMFIIESERERVGARWVKERVARERVRVCVCVCE